MTQALQQSTHHWFAMGSGYGQETKVVALINKEKEVETFLPLQRRERMTKGAKRKRVVDYRPVVANLLFVKASTAKMKELKGLYNSILQFKMRRVEGAYVPITVPEKQMSDFMLLYDNVDDEMLEFYLPDEITLRPNARVRIEDGIFAGVEGYYQQVRSKITKKGKNEKRFVVKIEGFLACAAVLAECRYVKLL